MGDSAFSDYLHSNPTEEQKREKLQELKNGIVQKRYDPTNPYVRTGRLWNPHA